MRESIGFVCNESAENAARKSDLIPAQVANANMVGILISITETGKREDNKRTFQNKRLVDRGWLRYDNLCHVRWCEPCWWAISLKRFPSLIRTTYVEGSPFVKGGFHNWRKGKEKITLHEESLMHKEAMQLFLAYQNRNIVEVVLQRKGMKKWYRNEYHLDASLKIYFTLPVRVKLCVGTPITRVTSNSCCGL